MGYNIGLRLIEDFLAKSNGGPCGNFKETAETVAKVRSRTETTTLMAEYFFFADETLLEGWIQDIP